MIEDYLREYGFSDDKIEKIITNISNDESIALSNMKRNIGILEDYGFSQREVIIIFSHFTFNISLYVLKPKKFDFLESLGLSPKEVRKISIKSPYILFIANRIIKNRITDLQGFGLDVDRLLRNNPNVFSVSDERFSDVVSWVKGKWPDEENYRKIFAKASAIFTLNVESLENKMMWFHSFGYDLEECAQIVLLCPCIICYGTQRYDERVELLKSMGFTSEEIKRIFRFFPAVLTLNEDTLREKLNVILDNGLRDIVLKKPLLLMQSAALTKARIAFLRSKEIDDARVPDWIFYGSLQFEKKFGISKSALYAMYSREKKILLNEKTS